jgi:hypothetical protein
VINNEQLTINNDELFGVSSVRNANNYRSGDLNYVTQSFCRSIRWTLGLCGFSAILRHDALMLDYSGFAAPPNSLILS